MLKENNENNEKLLFLKRWLLVLNFNQQITILPYVKSRKLSASRLLHIIHA